MVVIEKAYHWLADQYQDGDRIFLFGMSFSYSTRYSVTNSNPDVACRVLSRGIPGSSTSGDDPKGLFFNFDVAI